MSVGTMSERGELTDPTVRFLVFELDAQPYALPLAAVERIERAVAVTPLPNPVEYVLGIVNLRGEIIAVLDIRKRFSLPERQIDLDDRLIVARTRHRKVALVVNGVSDVIERREQDIISSEGILPGLTYVKGVMKLDDGLILIHDLNSFLAFEEEADLNEAIERHE
jgi:purine-binding chemotaxis protein CheW